MSHGGEGPAAVPPPPPRRAGLRAIGWSALCGLLIWVGEVVIGAVPLAAHERVARFTEGTESDPIPEVCILAVVISGLSVVSLARFGPHVRPFRHTPFMFVMLLVSVITLMSGAVMYGLAVMKLDRGHTELAYMAVGTALLTSFLVALEKAIRDA